MTYNESEFDRGSVRGLIGKKLKEWRASTGKSLKQVASEFGISMATWSRWEKGTRFPSPEFIPMLAQYMAVPVCELLYPSETGCPQCQRSSTRASQSEEAGRNRPQE